MNIRALAVVVALTAIPNAARADEPPPSAPPPAPVAYCCESPAIWTGIYIGGHVGGSWGDPTWTFPFAEVFNTAPGQSFPTSGSGAIGGGQIGFNYQVHRHFLIGVEVSYAGSGFSDTVVGPIAGFPLDRFTVSASDLLLVTGRLGYVHGQYLFYGKAGFASANVEVNANSASGTTASASARENGWTVGAGLESRIISNIIFGLEYNYVSLPGDRFTGVTAGAVPGTPFHADIDDLHMHTFVARLSILFGPQTCCGEGVLGKW
jgi:outer membrane immunogenic protein